MTHDEQKLLIQQLLDRIETLELENMVLKADLNTVDIPSETYDELVEKEITRKSIQSLTERILVDIENSPMINKGFVELPDGRLAYTKECEFFKDDEFSEEEERNQ